MVEKCLLGPHKELAGSLYEGVARLPLVCPHGHVNPRLLADPNYRFPNPVSLFLTPDHYLLRMLYSQGINLESFLRPEQNPRDTWKLFVKSFFLFWGTPSALWLEHQLFHVFGIEEPLEPAHSDLIYDQLSEKLSSQEFTPRALYKQFNIEVLCTTDAATDDLNHHRALREEGWDGRLLPTFRPDALLQTRQRHWRDEWAKLGEQVTCDVATWNGFLEGLAQRRRYFQSLGCVATDHGCRTPNLQALSQDQASRLFQKALRGEISAEESDALEGQLLHEMAGMSCEDGLVMQLHTGSYRDHNPEIHRKYGKDMGADIPVSVDFTRGLKPLLNNFGNHPNFRLLVFTLDESTYSRELAPLAGHYPCLLLGPPWWFHDSPNGMLRYLNQVMETAGIYNTAGFNDDTRAFCSIPARHDMWRRVSCRWLSELVTDGRLTFERARIMSEELATGRARAAYGL